MDAKKFRRSILLKGIKTVIGNILGVIFLLMALALVLCIVFGIIGKVAKLTYLTTLAGYCFISFLIMGGIVLPFGLYALVMMIKKIGFKQFALDGIKIFIPLFFIFIILSLITSVDIDWLELFLFSLVCTLLINARNIFNKNNK